MQAEDRLAAVLDVAALGGCAGTTRRHICYPAKNVGAPAWQGRAPEAVTVRSADGLTLGGLYRSPCAPRRDILVYFHGNGGYLPRDAARAAPLAADAKACR